MLTRIYASSCAGLLWVAPFTSGVLAGKASSLGVEIAVCLIGALVASLALAGFADAIRGR